MSIQWCVRKANIDKDFAKQILLQHVLPMSKSRSFLKAWKHSDGCGLLGCGTAWLVFQGP